MRNRRFEEIQAQTGMSSHLLANRLRRLEEDKIVERRVYSARPLRHEYYATPKGKDLDPVILALRNWDLRWGGSDGKGAAAVDLTDKKTGKAVDGTYNSPEGEVFSFSNTNSVMSQAWKAERDANLAAFHAGKQRSTPKTRAVKRAPADAKSPARKTTATRRAAPQPLNTKPPSRKKSAKTRSKVV